MGVPSGLILAALAVGGSAAWPHDAVSNITWAVEVSRVVYKHCVSCHHDGGQAFSLVTYKDAQPWANAIRVDILERRMPPWGAVTGVGDFRDDPSLSQSERDMIVGWLEAGAPEGNAAYLPKVPTFDSPAETAAVHIVRTVTVAAGIPQLLAEDSTVVAMVPLQGGDMELTAYEPDGLVEHLIWLRQYRPEWRRTFVCRTPVRLPKGTRVMLYGLAGVRVQLQLLRRASPPLSAELHSTRH